MPLKEDLGFTEPDETLEWAKKQLSKAEVRCKNAIMRCDPSADNHRRIVEHWKKVVEVLNGSN